MKLFDFGLCTTVRTREYENEAYDMTGNTGSLRYMAPEVALRKPYTEKVDVYRCVHRPPTSHRSSSFRPHIP